MALVVGVRAIA